MESLQSLVGGFAIALQPANLLFAVVGCVLGTLVGILPGIGPVAGTAMLIPLTFTIPPTAAIIMLAAIYYGAMYGGSLTSILVNVPGEAASAITCLDGYEMAKQGRAGPPWPWPPWDPSSAAPSPPSGWCCSRCRSPRWPSASGRPSSSR